MRLEEKVLKALRKGNVSISEIAEEILVSPKRVLRALEYLTAAGIIADAGEKSDIKPIQESEPIRRVLRKNPL